MDLTFSVCYELWPALCSITLALEAQAQARQQGIPIGSHVLISGLLSTPELNGNQGVVVSFDRNRTRYGVKLANGPAILLKPECLAAI